MNIQIAVAVTVSVFAICVVLLTHPRTLTRQRETGQLRLTFVVYMAVLLAGAI